MEKTAEKKYNDTLSNMEYRSWTWVGEVFEQGLCTEKYWNVMRPGAADYRALVTIRIA